MLLIADLIDIKGDPIKDVKLLMEQWPGGQLVIIEMLIEAGAGRDLKNLRGNTALMLDPKMKDKITEILNNRSF
jgi:hypothetical protein